MPCWRLGCLWGVLQREFFRNQCRSASLQSIRMAFHAGRRRSETNYPGSSGLCRNPNVIFEMADHLDKDMPLPVRPRGIIFTCGFDLLFTRPGIENKHAASTVISSNRNQFSLQLS